MKITCIDFETANPFWGSICAAGVAVIKNGEIIESFDMLIKPHPLHSEFNRDNIRVHGIKPEDVKDSPEFNEAYKKLGPLIEGKIIAAHNIDFDIGCLKDVLTLYNIPIPGFEYVCTHEISRKAWDGLKNYKLKTVSTYLGYEFRQHNAGEDARACANILIKAMEKYKASHVKSLAAVLGVNVHKTTAGEEHVLSSLVKKQRMADRIDAREIKPETCEFDASHPLFKKEIVFTGSLPGSMTRKQAMQEAVNAGAVLSNYVRRKTDFVVTGKITTFRSGSSKSSKLRKAEKLINEGADIKIINGEEFIEKLGKTGKR